MTDPAHVRIPLNLYHVNRPAAARVISNERITTQGCDEVRHIVLDRSQLEYQYVEGQSVGILTPGIDEKGHASKLRLYSIASGRLGDDGAGRTLSICVKRVLYRDAATGEFKHGVASTYLCDLKAGDSVSITGPVGNILLPDDPSSNLILVATGTGIAPYRGFLMHLFRELKNWVGQVHLFFGSKNRGECLYRQEFEGFRAFPNFQFTTALSREEQTPGGERMYVHHRMAERVVDLWTLLDIENTYMYICGIRGMEEGIYRVFEARAKADGISWHAFHRVLLDTGRLMIETY